MIAYLVENNGWLIPAAVVFIGLAWIASLRPKEDRQISQHLPQSPQRLPLVYLASNVQAGRDYFIWCAETGESQTFHVRQIAPDGEWFEVKFSGHGGVYQGWVTEIPSNVHLHGCHLNPKPEPKTPRKIRSA